LLLSNTLQENVIHWGFVGAGSGDGVGVGFGVGGGADVVGGEAAGGASFGLPMLFRVSTLKRL
jgi:hypothetical protein